MAYILTTVTSDIDDTFYIDDLNVDSKSLEILIKADRFGKTSPINPSLTKLQSKLLVNGFDVYFNKFYFPNDKDINLGNIASDQNIKFDIMNSFFAKASVKNIEINGLDVGNITPTIKDIGIMDTVEFTISVPFKGNNYIDTTIVFVLDDDYRMPIRLTGSRVLVFPIYPNWYEGYKENLEWFTDIMESHTGIEQRMMIRKFPRQSITYSILPIDKDNIGFEQKQRFELLLQNNGSRVFILPLWTDITSLSKSINTGSNIIELEDDNCRFIENEILLFMLSDTLFEVVEIATINKNIITSKSLINNNITAGTLVMPGISVRLDDSVKFQRFNKNVIYGDVKFNSVNHAKFNINNEIKLYKNYFVLNEYPTEYDLDYEYKRDIAVIDNKSNAPLYIDKHNFAKNIQTWEYIALNKKEKCNILNFLYNRAGRYSLFWMPTFANDITIIDDINTGQNILIIEPINAPSILQYNDKKHIRIDVWDGTVYYKEISGASIVDELSERIILTEQFTNFIAKEDILTVSFMNLVNIAHDNIEIEHLGDDVMKIKLNVELNNRVL